MTTRVLIVIALIIAAIAGWFFGQQEEVAPSITTPATDVDYEATDIQAVQTNDSGETEYELNAESLTHNPTTNQDEMSGITMNWQPNEQQRYTIDAGKAVINQQTGELQLSGAFRLASVPSESAEVAPIVIEGTTLMGNTKSRQLYSNEPVTVVQGINRFRAASMTANLETGEYEFGQVAVSFLPPERQDEALF